MDNKLKEDQIRELELKVQVQIQSFSFFPLNIIYLKYGRLDSCNRRFNVQWRGEYDEVQSQRLKNNFIK